MLREHLYRAVGLFAVLGAVLLLALPGAAFAPNASTAQVRDVYFASHNSNNQIVGGAYSYDSNGNATDYRGFEFDYDYEDLPTGVTGGMYGDGSVTMAFRADGLRAWKSSNNGGWFSYYLYDGDKVVCELDSSGNLQSDGAYAYGPNGLVLWREVSTANRYLTYAFDPLGSHVQTLYFNGSSLSIRRFAVYDAFGKRHWDKTSTGSDTNIPGCVGYAGQWGCYTDHETRMSQTDTPLVLTGIRYYDPITARFVTRDPMLGINDYAYCGNNPVGRVDSDGQVLETIADVVGIGWSTYDLIRNPSWANLGYLAWDVGATIVPFVPGSYTAKGVKIASKGIKAATKTRKATQAAKVAKGGSKGIRAARSAIEIHHLLPRQFKRQFARVGLDIEKFKIPMSKAGHRLKPGGLHTGPENWNRMWDQFFKETKNPSKKQILNQLEYMRGRFGIK